MNNNLVLNQTTMNSIQLSRMMHMDKKEVHRKIKLMFQLNTWNG